MKAHRNNFCGGSFSDWLAVNLLSNCNAKCKFCIEKKEGFVQKHKANWKEMANAIVKSDKKKVMLLGGEPTLYKNLRELINYVKDNSNKEIYLTTNGFLLNKKYIEKNLINLTGLSISICHYDQDKNKELYGLKHNIDILKEAINYLKSINILTRLNCNLLPGYIDSVKEIYKMIKFSKEIGASEIRISETFSDTQHIKLEELFSNQFGLNDEPFEKGCLTTAIINNYKVVLRQACGLETTNRKSPINPDIEACNDILYPNGSIYFGWLKKEVENINPVILNQLIDDQISERINKIRSKIC